MRDCLLLDFQIDGRIISKNFLKLQIITLINYEVIHHSILKIASFRLSLVQSIFNAIEVNFHSNARKDYLR
jgi:hypothetical protein